MAMAELYVCVCTCVWVCVCVCLCVCARACACVQMHICISHEIRKWVKRNKWRESRCTISVCACVCVYILPSTQNKEMGKKEKTDFN